MIRVYYLPVEIVNGAEQVAGIEFIHDALLDCTDDPLFRVLVMDTTDAEHAGLIATADSWIEAPQETIDLYNAQVIILPPDPDIARAEEILHNPTIPIPTPDLSELVRIFGRFHGLTF